MAHLGKEAGSPEAAGLSPAEQSSTASGAAPAPSATARGDKEGDGTAPGHGQAARGSVEQPARGDVEQPARVSVEQRARGDVEQGTRAPDQLPAATADSQARGSSKELQGVSPSGLPPAKGAPQSKPETKTSPGAQSLQAGKESKQKGNSSTVKVSVSELW